MAELELQIPMQQLEPLYEAFLHLAERKKHVSDSDPVSRAHKLGIADAHAAGLSPDHR
ncbi:hypothetical protein [Silvibacterium sp.]|uniref:hypothetical protein n=1 Tax=Silvibacterium sp. TaxID=1964179 RepID=UPI0039E6980F